MNRPRFYFEWPRSSDGWRTEELMNFRKHLLHEVRFDGCAYNLVGKKGEALKKEWQVISTEKEIDHLKEFCPGHEEHGQIQGKDATTTGRYTKELVEKIIEVFKAADEGEEVSSKIAKAKWIQSHHTSKRSSLSL